MAGSSGREDQLDGLDGQLHVQDEVTQRVSDFALTSASIAIRCRYTLRPEATRVLDDV
jgi:hypothetical protein